MADWFASTMPTPELTGLPDALAAGATDVNRDKRRLYKDNDINIQRARAWVVITSANPTFASDPGLADRVPVIRLERRTDETAESALSDEIGRNRDAGLSWLAETLSKALADRKPVTGNLNRRHTEDADPLYGGGEIVTDCEPTQSQRYRHGIIVFTVLAVASSVGVYYGLADRKDR